jgi:hypothetical protein
MKIGDVKNKRGNNIIIAVFWEVTNICVLCVENLSYLEDEISVFLRNVGNCILD